MPFIDAKFNIEVTKEKEIELKEKLGKAIEAFPGKTEQWLMLSFEDNQRMYFRGSNDRAMAYLEVKLLGDFKRESSQDCTKIICGILKDTLNIDGDMVYIKYESIRDWGYNGVNF